MRTDVHGHSLEILNCYWMPNQNIWLLSSYYPFQQCLTPHCTVVILGDFNCQHPSWGYDQASALGSKLDTFMSNQKVSLLNDVTTSTRLGNSRENTNPGLTWSISRYSIQWENTEDTLGSDHSIIEIQLPLRTQRASRTPRHKTICLIDWNKARQRLELDEIDKNTNTTEWTNNVLQVVSQHATHIATTEDHPQVDIHLLALLELRHRLVSWWCHAKNRTLHQRIHTITQESQEYADHLDSQRWWQTCEDLNGQLHTPRVWQIF